MSKPNRETPHDPESFSKSEWESNPVNYIIKLINEDSEFTNKYEEIGTDWSWVEDETPQKKGDLERKVKELVQGAIKYATKIHPMFSLEKGDDNYIVRELVVRINSRKSSQGPILRSKKRKN